jgi:hypothetical protein
MGRFPHAPGSLVVFGITCLVAGGVLILLLAWHVARRVLDIPPIPRGAGGYVVQVVVCLALLGAGIIALAVAAGLEDWQGVPGTTPLAEVQCHRITPASAQLTFVPLRADGARGPEEGETVSSCDLSIERLHFIRAFSRFGLVERNRLAQVGTRRRPIEAPNWTALPSPFGVPVAVATVHKVVVPDGDRYRAIADESGLRLEK